MVQYLDSRVPLESYRGIVNTRFFVDKTLLLEDVLKAVEIDGQRYLCITRPRRFGKSVMANMVAAFLGRAEEAGDIFGRLEIAQSEWYDTHLNQYPVIYIDFSEVPENCVSYHAYISRILDSLKRDLLEEFSEIVTDAGISVWDLLTNIFQKTGKKFIFVIDEWDAVFHMSFVIKEDQKRLQKE